MNIQAPHQEALTDEGLALVGRLHEELDGRRRRAARRPPGAPAGARCRRIARIRDRARGLPGRAGAGRAPGPARRDHGTDQPQDGHQCPELGRARLHGGLRGFELADVEQHDRGAAQPHRRDQRQHRARREGQALRAGPGSRRPTRPAARPSPPRGAPPGRWPAGGRGVHGLRSLRAPQCAGAARPRLGSVLLHPEAGVPSARRRSGATRS